MLGQGRHREGQRDSGTDKRSKRNGLLQAVLPTACSAAGGGHKNSELKQHDFLSTFIVQRLSLSQLYSTIFY